MDMLIGALILLGYQGLGALIYLVVGGDRETPAAIAAVMCWPVFLPLRFIYRFRDERRRHRELLRRKWPNPR